MQEIANADLTEHDLPPPGAGWEQHSETELIRFVLWDAAALKSYQRAAQELFVA
jgi:hypothetical protein